MRKTQANRTSPAFGETNLYNFLKEVTENINQLKPTKCEATTLRLTGGYGADWEIIDKTTAMIAWVADSKTVAAAYRRFLLVKECAAKRAVELIEKASQAELIEGDRVIEQGDWGLDEIGTVDQINLDCPQPCKRVEMTYSFLDEMIYFQCNHGSTVEKISFKALIEPQITSLSEALERRITAIQKAAIDPLTNQLAVLHHELDTQQQELAENNAKLTAHIEAQSSAKKRGQRNKLKARKSTAVEQAERPVKRNRTRIRQIKEEMAELRTKISGAYMQLGNDAKVLELQARQDELEQMVEGPNFSACARYLVNRTVMLAKSDKSKSNNSSNTQLV